MLKFLHFFQKSTTVCPRIFENFLKFGPWSNILIFEAACFGDVRHRISIEISSFDLTIMKILFHKAIFKRFSHGQISSFFSEFNDGLYKDFSKFLENWTIIKHGKFGSIVRGRRQASHFRLDIVIWTDDNEDIRLWILPVILIASFCSIPPR